jgi:hypothetical protein
MKPRIVLALVIMLTSCHCAAGEDDALVDCGNGSCPTSFTSSDTPARSQCGLWLGPSPIKDAEHHGFGLGMFAGRLIPKGAIVESLYSPAGELVVPIYSSSIDENHPPLREYVWDDGNLIEISTENPDGTTFLFIPGLAAIAPCTSQNFNLVMSSASSAVDSDGVHRATHPTAGSFSYRHNVTYTAVRDIVPGEELTVYCNDDNFDGGAYYLSTFQSSDDAVVCLDTNLRLGTSTLAGVGQGLFAKRTLSKGSVITSTPLVPIHRNELNDAVNGNEPSSISQKQLLLNYCFGHPNSDLLLLPYGPMASHLNHGKEPNAVIQWHSAKTTILPRRQQFHHLELLEWTADEVADTHGMGLMMDIVALKTIQPNEEILVDYGVDWMEAYNAHVRSWSPKEGTYKSASGYSSDGALVRTELEQKHTPYPETLRVMCFYDKKLWFETASGDPTTEHRSSWASIDDTDHVCMRPCTVLERTNTGTESNDALYTVEMVPGDNSEVYRRCHLSRVTVVSDMPRHAIQILDRPYTADVFLPDAFRHAMGVPDGFYPESWMRKKLRRKAKSGTVPDSESFKRKQTAK